MDMQALFKISHGMYITGAVDTDGRLVGSVIDSAMVVEAAPAQVLISMNESSYTRAVVEKTKRLALSVLPQSFSPALIKRFGYQSSKTADKWKNTPHDLCDGLPVLKGCVTYMALRVLSTMNTAHHTVFLCQVEKIVPCSMGVQMTYDYYQQHVQPKMKEIKMAEKQWVCTICGYVYDGDIPFEELPDDYLCPICAQPKSVFVEEDV